MYDPQTLVHSNKLFEIWHVDPCKDGSDDSCGWFKRGRHGDKEILKKIESRFNFDWDRTFKPDASDKTYCQGYFYPSGYPNQSVLSIGLNLFWMAALEHFKCNVKKTNKFMQENLFKILAFVENPFDSLSDSITLKFGNDTKREERIHSIAYCIYGWILRADTPWYKHPRFHIHHYKITILPLRRLWNWLTQRCAICKKGFKYNECRIGNWTGDKVWHEHCNNTLRKS